MPRELIGQLLGIALVVVGAWFAALVLMTYSLGSPWPWDWSPTQRGIHLAVQTALVLAYFLWPRRAGE